MRRWIAAPLTTTPERQAFTLLTQASQKDGDDVQVLNALGTLANMKGDSLEAGHLFSSVLALDPKNRTAATDLAVLEARNHHLAQARALLQPVFDRNQDLPGVAENLAAIDCLQGDGDAARTTLEAALRFSPALTICSSAFRRLAPATPMVRRSHCLTSKHSVRNEIPCVNLFVDGFRRIADEDSRYGEPR